MKCRYCGGELGDPELCPEGEQLLCRVYTVFDELYDEYREHLINCKECQEKMGLTDEEIDYLRSFLDERRSERHNNDTSYLRWESQDTR